MRPLLFAFLLLLGAVGGDAYASDKAPPENATTIFLVDTSATEDAKALPGRIAAVKAQLEKDASIKNFQVLTFDVATRWAAPELLANDEAGRAMALAFLDTFIAEGACDLDAALNRLARLDVAKETPVRVIVLHGGKLSWGETDPRLIVERFRQKCPYPVKFTVPEAANPDLAKRLAVEANQQDAKLSRRDQFDTFLNRVEQQVKLREGKSGEHVKLLLKSLKDDDFELKPSPDGDRLWKRADLPEDYVRLLTDNPRNTEGRVREAKRRGDAGDAEGLVRALSSIVALRPDDAEAQRLVGYRLLDAKEPLHAIRLFEKVQAQRPLEPHSYRDLARGLEDAGKFGQAAVQYEVLLAGNWHGKYTNSLKEVVQEEYAHMMRDSIRAKKVANRLIDVFGERLESFDSAKFQADLRVAISWNTDATDVDLWVTEPGGEKCFYGHQKTANGGELTQDVTQGYGPERYQMVKAKPGEYIVQVHFFSGPRNPQAIEGTHVNIVVRRFAGTPQEESQRLTVVLRNQNDLVEVCRLKY